MTLHTNGGPGDGTAVPIAPCSGFAFECRPGVPCFNACCRDLSQVLTPYDVLRLARGLGLRTGEFLRRYTVRRTGPGSGLPVLSLAPGDPVQLTCPFLSQDGCTVYAHRPSSCRTYPLVRMVRRHRETGRLAEEYWVLREPHCRGFEADRTWTPAEWTAGQGLEAYHRENDLLLDLIASKNRTHPRPLPPTLQEIAAVCLYDVDRLREEPDPGGAAAPADDLALLRIGRERLKRLLREAAGGPHEGDASWT
jgi:Fe-S-cluster containining protein